MQKKRKMQPNNRLLQARLSRHWSQRALAEKLGTTYVTICRWERGQSRPNAYFRHQLCALFQMSEEDLGFFVEADMKPSPSRSESASITPQNVGEQPLHLPFRRNPLFTGREAVLGELQTIFHRLQASSHQRIVALSGLAGVGKTQVALEYAYRYRTDYGAILFIHAESDETLITDILLLADLLHLPKNEEQNKDTLVAALRGWLAAHNAWLLILDNLEDAALLEKVVPSVDAGAVLLTTRMQALEGAAHTLNLAKMAPDEGALLLLRRARMLLPHESLACAQSAQVSRARQICRVLDGLPLALDQAGAYIDESRCSLSDYLDRYQQERARMLNLRTPVSGYTAQHPLSVASTFSLAFERIERLFPPAADLLRLCAFLHPDAIPEELVAAEFQNPLQLDRAIATLRTSSLLSRDAETRLLSLHRLVQAVVQDQIGRERFSHWAGRAIVAVSQAFPPVAEQGLDVKLWPQAQRLAPHARVCAALIQQEDLLCPEAVALLYHLSSYFIQRGSFAGVEEMLLLGLELCERLRGAEHLETAGGATALGPLYMQLGRFQEAEAWLLRGLELRRRFLDALDLDVLNSLNVLGLLYGYQGNYAQAEPCFLEALAIYEGRNELHQPDAATLLNNLANLYREQQRPEEAERAFLRMLQIYEACLESEHPTLAMGLNNLAVFYRDQGRYAEAAPLFQRALAIRIRHLGEEHPDTARTQKALATLYYEQGQYQAAEPLFRSALRVWELRFGCDHPDVARCLCSLAQLYQARGNAAEAAPLYQRALAIFRQTYGPEHPRTKALQEQCEPQ